MKNIFSLCLSLIFGLSFAQSEIKIEHIRNATTKITYAGKTFLIDPMLAEKGRYEGFEGSFNSHLRNPLVELPMPKEDVIKGVDAVIITHTHLDHWDEVAAKIIPKKTPIFVQNDQDAQILKSQGFKKVNVLSMERGIKFGDITLYKTGGSHGEVEMYSVPFFSEGAGEAMGVVFQAPNQKTIYVMGDSVWSSDIYKALHKYKPEIAIMNTGDARFLFAPDSQIIMSKNDVVKLAQFSPNIKIVAVHMEAVNHCTITRADIEQIAKENNIQNRVFTPKDGEVLKF